MRDFAMNIGQMFNFALISYCFVYIVPPWHGVPSHIVRMVILTRGSNIKYKSIHFGPVSDFDLKHITPLTAENRHILTTDKLLYSMLGLRRKGHTINNVHRDTCKLKVNYSAPILTPGGWLIFFFFFFYLWMCMPHAGLKWIGSRERFNSLKNGVFWTKI